MNGTIRRAMARTMLGAAATTALSAGAWVASAGGAMATPPETGCPTAYSQLSVADLTPQGYHLPAIIDAAGNNDGYVCGQPVVEASAENFCGGPCQVPILYRFRDNTNTPGF
jgi:hypothetical protein